MYYVLGRLPLACERLLAKRKSEDHGLPDLTFSKHKRSCILFDRNNLFSRHRKTDLLFDRIKRRPSKYTFQTSNWCIMARVSDDRTSHVIMLYR